MDAFWAALASGAALALLGEAVKSGLGRWFRVLRPDRVDRCPRCGREHLVRALSTAETAWFSVLVLVFTLAFTATVLLGFAAIVMLLAVLFGGMPAGPAVWVAVWLAVSTLVTRTTVRPIAHLRARPPVRCRDCGHRWP